MKYTGLGKSDVLCPLVCTQEKNLNSIQDVKHLRNLKIKNKSSLEKKKEISKKKFDMNWRK